MKPAFLLIVLALAVRLCFYFYLQAANPQKFQIRDLDGYAAIAENLLHVNEYSRAPAPPYVPDFSRPPVYPALLAGLMVLGRNSGSLIVLFQCLLSTGLVGLAWMLGGQLGLDRTTRFTAGLLIALDPILILLPHYLLSDTLFLVLWMAGLVLLARFLNLRNSALLLVSAALFALGALTRPVLEYFPLLAVIAVIWMGGKKGWGPKIRDALLFLSLFAALLLPWMLRNQALGAGFILSDIADTNLYYYRAKAVLADAENISQEAAYQRLDEEIQAKRQAQGLSAADSLEVMRARAFEILAQHPLQTLKMTARGAALLLIDPGYSLVCADLDPTNLTPECFRGEATMLGGNIFTQIAAGFISMSLLQKGTLIWSTILTGLLYLGALLGAIRLARAKRWSALALLLGSILYFVVLSSGAESLYRLRAPILPLLALLCGVEIGPRVTGISAGARQKV